MEYFYERLVEFLYRILSIFIHFVFVIISEPLSNSIMSCQNSCTTGSNSCHDRKLWIQISVSATRQPMLNSRNGSNSRTKFEGWNTIIVHDSAISRWIAINPMLSDNFNPAFNLHFQIQLNRFFFSYQMSESYLRSRIIIK